jgi:hypothetical protein
MQWPTVCFANFKLWRFSVPFHWHPAHVAHTITKVLNPLRKTIQIAGLVPAGPRSTFHDPVVNLDLHAFYAPVSFVDAEMGFSSQDWWRRGGILKGWNLPRPDSSRKLISAWSTKLIAALSERLCSETRVLDFFFQKGNIISVYGNVLSFCEQENARYRYSRPQLAEEHASPTFDVTRSPIHIFSCDDIILCQRGMDESRTQTLEHRVVYGLESMRLLYYAVERNPAFPTPPTILLPSPCEWKAPT